MQKSILITGSTDGIGLATAKMLVAQGHRVLLHGRNPEKLQRVEETLTTLPGGGAVESYRAELSRLNQVAALARAVADNHARLDVLINNAGVYRVPESITPEGLDTRFAVNTIVPYLLTQRLLSLLGHHGRVVNLSSAAQAPLNPSALAGPTGLPDGTIYAQSKLALTMWSRQLALKLGDAGPVIIAVNPKSMLGSKMVMEAYGVAGSDLRLGAEIVCRAALDDAFASASGKYFDNDIGRFAPPHSDALDARKCEAVVQTMEAILGKWNDKNS